MADAVELQHLGYRGRAEYDPDAGVWHGDAIGIRDVVTCEADTAAGLPSAFAESIDDYLAMCRARGEGPDTMTVGQHVTRECPRCHVYYHETDGHSCGASHPEARDGQ